MELVYLWVEDYKNIQKQEFNFSPRFTCKYDEDTQELTVDKNKDILENFFGENINITAIVGENGSGKSSIIDIIQECVENNLYTEYILVYIDNNKLKYISKSAIVSDLPQGIYKELAQNTFVYNKCNHISYPFRAYGLIETDKKAIVNILVTMCDNPKFKISTFMYLPVEIEIKLKDSETLIEETIIFFNPLNREKVKQIFSSISDPYHQYLFITYGRQQTTSCNIDILNNMEKLKAAVQEPISENNYYTYFIVSEDEEIFKITKLTEKQKKIYIKKRGCFHFFDFDMIDEENRRFNHLSHGEQMIFAQLLNIYYYSNFNNNLIFLFDEPEIALHPNWQKRYMNEVIVLLDSLKKHYHFIFTTHSPLLISDLPKENVIFLKDGKQEDVDINPFGANIHTLLSHGFFMKDGLMGEFAKNKINIIINFYKKIEENEKHENELEKVQKKLEYKKEYEDKKKYFKYIQSIIGEDYLKQVIKNHIIEIEKILYEDKYIDSEIEKTKQKLKRLEAIKDAKN